jgi:hypothetical protein
LSPLIDGEVAVGWFCRVSLPFTRRKRVDDGEDEVASGGVEGRGSTVVDHRRSPNQVSSDASVGGCARLDDTFPVWFWALHSPELKSCGRHAERCESRAPTFTVMRGGIGGGRWNSAGTEWWWGPMRRAWLPTQCAKGTVTELMRIAQS